MKIICVYCPTYVESTTRRVSIEDAVKLARDEGWFVDVEPPEELMRGICPDCLKVEAKG